MFELSVALKYLTPRWRQLSVSIISLISILVIALVVWLIVVFFSVTRGLEEVWTDKLIALTAPVRVTPTEYYYGSYYYQIDSISAASDYTYKSIGEKRVTRVSDPYDSDLDEELPSTWIVAERTGDGQLVDPVKQAFAIIGAIDGLHAEDYEVTLTNLKLRLLRNSGDPLQHGYTQSFLNQSSYLGTFDAGSPVFDRALLPLTAGDYRNVLSTAAVAAGNQEQPEVIERVDPRIAAARFRAIFERLEIKTVKLAPQGTELATTLIPDGCRLSGCITSNSRGMKSLYLPQNATELLAVATELEQRGIDVKRVEVDKRDGKLFVGKDPLPTHLPLILVGDDEIAVEGLSFIGAAKVEELKVNVALPLQGAVIRGEYPFGNLIIGKVNEKPAAASSFWLAKENGEERYQLPSRQTGIAEGILLPRPFRDGGVLVGDRGYVSFYAPTISRIKEQRIPVVVAGFYDPGILPVGGKFILASKELTNLVRAAHDQGEALVSNGINIRIDDITQAEKVKRQLESAFTKAGISDYWQVETYREYEFTRDIVQQLQSEKNLFTLLATIIMVVACSNIVSMLIILVNDKKIEIGILRAMGASTRSIATIFGFCGLTLGFAGSIVGITLATYTLRHLQELVNLISKVQGFEMFNPSFYGDTLPSTLHYETLGFVLVMTLVVSAIAGVVPAIKAGLLRPSEILKAE